MDRGEVRNAIYKVGAVVAGFLLLWAMGLKVTVEFLPHSGLIWSVPNSTSSVPNTSVSPAQSSTQTPAATVITVPLAQILVRMSTVMGIGQYDSGLSEFDVAKSVALALHQKMASSQLFVFSGAGVDESSSDYVRAVDPDSLGSLDATKAEGVTSFEAAIRMARSGDGSTIIFITDADVGESGLPLTLETVNSLRYHHNKLIFLVLNPYKDAVNPIYESAAELTGGKVISVDPLNIGAAVNATLDALK